MGEGEGEWEWEKDTDLFCSLSHELFGRIIPNCGNRNEPSYIGFLYSISAAFIDCLYEAIFNILYGKFEYFNSF